jgi:hypothetical protein
LVQPQQVQLVRRTTLRTAPARAGAEPARVLLLHLLLLMLLLLLALLWMVLSWQRRRVLSQA